MILKKFFFQISNSILLIIYETHFVALTKELLFFSLSFFMIIKTKILFSSQLNFTSFLVGGQQRTEEIS